MRPDRSCVDRSCGPTDPRSRFVLVGVAPRETIIVSNVAELSIAIDYEEPILTVQSMIHHYIDQWKHINDQRAAGTNLIARS